MSSVNTISSCDIVHVILAYEVMEDESRRVYVGGAYAERSLAEREASRLVAQNPNLTTNIVGTFLDALAGFYPGFGGL